MSRSEIEGSLHAGKQVLMSMMAEQKQEQTAQPEEEANQEEQETSQTHEEAEDTEDTLEESGEQEDQESDEEETEEEETLSLKWNGETIEVPVSEAISLAQKGFDYSQKLSQLSEKAKEEGKKLYEAQLTEMEAKRTEFAQKAELVEALYGQPLVSQDKLDQLREDGDWDEFHRLKDQEESRQRLLSEVKREKEQTLAQQQEDYNKRLAEFRKTEIAKVQDKLRDLQDGGWDSFRASFKKAYQVGDEDFDNIATAKGYEIAYKALKYDELMSKGVVKPRSKGKSPNVTKKKSVPTPKSSVAQQRINDSYKQFKNKGNVRTAADLFKTILTNEK